MDQSTLVQEQYDEIELQLPLSNSPKFFEHCYTIKPTRTPSRLDGLKSAKRRNSRASRAFFDKISEFRVDTRADRSGFESVALSNAIVSGKLENGLPNGYCQARYSDGSVFKGTCAEGNRISGLMTFPDKTAYMGEFRQELFHGWGKLLMENRVVEGIWREGGIVGNARITYQNGDVYYGGLKEFKKHGTGTLYFENGYQYAGDFNEGKITGWGTYSKDGTIAKQGMWLDGVLKELQ